MPVKRAAPITWRPPKALRDKLEALAAEKGMALASVIQELIERGLSILDGGAVPERKKAVKPQTGRARTSPCEHRRAPEDFCSRCDV